MAKLLWSVTMSLDGHIGPNPTVDTLIADIDALLVGSRSDITFVHTLDDGVAAAEAAAGDKYINVLGADIARQTLDAGLIDAILVGVAPVLFGDGVRLLDHPGGTNVKLERIGLTQAPLATNIWMRVAA